MVRFEPISRSHPGLVSLLHVGRNDAQGYFYYVMELADPAGSSAYVQEDSYVPKTLKNPGMILPENRLRAAVELGLPLSEALQCLHSHGLVHRDIKPANILIMNAQPKLADIGLVIDPAEVTSVVGTLGYLPDGDQGTPAADLYALGMVLYEMATGQTWRSYPAYGAGFLAQPGAREFRDVIDAVCFGGRVGRRSVAEFTEALQRLRPLVG